jgi:hypothetical protein
MLTPRLTNCVNCPDILTLISDIDCKVADISNQLYNNAVFMLNQSIPQDVIEDLLNYKRILLYKYCNPEYNSTYTIGMIASKVKLLKYK